MEYDDANSVSRICVTCKEPVNQIFVSVPYSKWWVSPAKRTMYVEVADGTSLDEMQEIAEDMAGSISITGRNESFVGIFTPQLILGDEVRMIDSSGKAEVIGTVTDVKHHIGRKEFYTKVYKIGKEKNIIKKLLMLNGLKELNAFRKINAAINIILNEIFPIYGERVN